MAGSADMKMYTMCWLPLLLLSSTLLCVSGTTLEADTDSSLAGRRHLLSHGAPHWYGRPLGVAALPLGAHYTRGVGELASLAGCPGADRRMSCRRRCGLLRRGLGAVHGGH